MEKINITIIGAGVIGLAIARELSQKHTDIFVIEKNSSFGEETSSRNSEVIHAGIYYPKDSLKAKTCIEGKNLLYEFCAKNNIAHKRIGKLIVAIHKDEINDLEALLENGRDSGVGDLKIISREEAMLFEPHIECVAAIFSPSTGIIDTHGFMNNLVGQFEGNGGAIAYNTEVIGIDKADNGFAVTVKDIQGQTKFFSRLVINCAGLNSDKVAAFSGLNKPEYKLKYCKGDYFRVAPGKSKFINHLVYPVPKHNRAGLGIHATLDLAGSLRLGPDDEYVKAIDYRVDPLKAAKFQASAATFMPFINLEDLSPDTSGMRPKLQGPGEEFRDFIIQDETINNLAGLINLIGIESPGFTASLAIARIVRQISAKLI